MKKRKFGLFAAAVAVMLSVGLAGCGDKNDNTDMTQPTAMPTEAPAEPTKTPNDTSGDNNQQEDETMGTTETIKTIAETIPQTASGRDFTYVKELDGIWKFGGLMQKAEKVLAADYSSWEEVTIPHTWNAKDAEDGGGNYVRTTYWYHKEFEVGDLSGKRLYAEFLGSNTKTDVYVNGEKVGDTHKGGYTAFRYDITEFVKAGTNVMDVCVNNQVDQSIAPISGDFNMYGGIYRRVYLVTVDEVHVDLDNHGSSGLFLTTGNMRSKEAPADLGEFQVKTDIVNDSAEDKIIDVVITVQGDNAPAPVTETVTVPAGGTLAYTRDMKVENPTLWEGICYDKNAGNKNVGYRYTVSVELKEGGTVLDKVEDKLGFRYFWIDVAENGEAGEGFFLNGRAFPLRGVNRHSYLAGVGSAMTEEMHAADMEIMLELGINTVRLCHYPHTDYFYDLCDENGLVVWTEIPTVNMIGTAKDFEEVTKKQLTELIYQQYNRPSVIVWGLENEIGNGTDLFKATANLQVAKAKALLYNLDALAKELDTTGRYTTQAVNRDYAMNQNAPDSVNKNFENNTGWKSDIVAWNIYPGWYPDANFYGTFEDVMVRKGALDSRSMGISEYGWGANPYQHEANPALGVNNLTSGGQWHPEEYQNLMNEEALAYINIHNELWGTYYWVMFDFAVDARNEGGRVALNDKGLVTDDRAVKKDSFYLYKANWNKKDSFVYITSRRWDKREEADTYIKIYSNCEEVELFINDKSLGKMEAKGNGVFLMENVTLEVGEIVVKAVGTIAGDVAQYTDTCTWIRELSNNAELKSEAFVADETGNVLYVDRQVTVKEFKELVQGANNSTYTIWNDGKEVTVPSASVTPGFEIKVTAEDGKTTATYQVQSRNLCINREVTVSSYETGNVGPNAVDGDSKTRWVAVNGTYPQSITVDLAEVYAIGDLTLEWDTKGGNRHYRYYVEVSEDGVNYIEVLDKRSNTTMGTITDSLKLAKGRYLRITATGCNVAGWATLFEIKADGYALTSEVYTIDDAAKEIAVDAIPEAGMAEGTFMEGLSIKGNYSYRVNLSSGWVHAGNTVDILDGSGNVVVTYTIVNK